MIKFTCSDCGFALEAEESEAGKLIRCRSCEALIAVPQPAEGGPDFNAAALEELSESARMERSIKAVRGMAVLVGGGALLLSGVAIFCCLVGSPTPPAAGDAPRATPEPSHAPAHVQGAAAEPTPTTSPTDSTAAAE